MCCEIVCLFVFRNSRGSILLQISLWVANTTRFKWNLSKSYSIRNVFHLRAFARKRKIKIWNPLLLWYLSINLFNSCVSKSSINDFQLKVLQSEYMITTSDTCNEQWRKYPWNIVGKYCCVFPLWFASILANKLGTLNIAHVLATRAIHRKIEVVFRSSIVHQPGGRDAPEF